MAALAKHENSCLILAPLKGILAQVKIAHAKHLAVQARKEAEAAAEANALVGNANDRINDNKHGSSSQHKRDKKNNSKRKNRSRPQSDSLGLPTRARGSYSVEVVVF